MLPDLDAARPLLADGAMGTGLFLGGLSPGSSPELWNARHPDLVMAMHRGFVAAGADIILTNSFGANRRRLSLHGLEGRCAELNASAARLARRAIEAAGRPVAVAGSVGPTGDFHAPGGQPSEEQTVMVFGEQVEALAEAGVDLLWIETMSAPAEMRAAAVAAHRIGLPFVMTASFDRGGCTLAGLSPAAFADLMATLPKAPLAIGSNCGSAPSDVLASVAAMKRRREDLKVVAKPSAGIPVFRDGVLRYPAGPAAMGKIARQAIEAGAVIVGGCCGTTPQHLAAMRAALDRHSTRGTPAG